MKLRVTASALLVASIIFLPYWLYLPLLLMALAYFPLYWEGVLLGFLVGALYGPEQAGFDLMEHKFALLAAAIILIAMLVKERLRI